MEWSLTSNTFIKYGLIGVVNTLFGYGIIFIFIYFGVIAEISNFLGYLLGLFLSYYLNKRYNFKSNRGHTEDLPRFILGMGIAYLLNLFTMVIAYRLLSIDIYISQIIAGVVYTLSGYVISKIWIFKN
jgi:putative flippase GtrA